MTQFYVVVSENGKDIEYSGPYFTAASALKEKREMKAHDDFMGFSGMSYRLATSIDTNVFDEIR